MGRRRGAVRAGCAAAVVALLVVALSACNPLVNQTTKGYEGYPPFIPASSSSGRYDLVGTESGWLEVQVIDATSPEVWVSGGYRDPERSTCWGSDRATQVWSGGASLGFQRLERVDPGVQFSVTVAGSADPIRFNLRVVDDAGEPVGDVAPHVPPDGQFEDVGCAIS